LAVNPSSISHVTTAWSREHKQTILRLHLVGSGSYVAVLGESAEDVLIDLGLGEYVENYTLDLTKDLG
jgi:prefoldin subunit 5